MSCNHDVEGSDRGHCRCKRGTDLPGMFGGADIEVQKCEAAEQSFDDVEVSADGL